MTTTTTKTAPSAGSEIDLSDDVLTQAANRFGVKLPTAEAPQAEAEGDTTADGDGETETDDSAESEGAEDDSEAEASAEDADSTEELPDDEADKAAAAEKARNDADLKKLPEAARAVAQSIINKRIGQITARTKADKAALDARVTELETELAETKEIAEGKPRTATVVGGVHALLLDPSEDAIGKYIEGIEAFEDWAAEHADGYEPTAEEFTKGARPASAGELRQRLRAVQREREQLVPKARAVITARTAHDTEAKKLIPALFDAKSPDYQAARSLLREQPELKRFPDYHLRVAEILLGRKALADLRTASAKKTTKPDAPAIKKAPRVPGSGGPAKGGVAERKQGGSDAPTAVTNAIKDPTQANKRAAALAVLGM